MKHLRRHLSHVSLTAARWATAASLALVIAVAAVAETDSQTLYFHATASGQQTLDQGEGGGNPFASALITLLARPALALRDLPAELQRLTSEKSGGFQTADGARVLTNLDWRLGPGAPGEKRIALILVVSDYSASGGAPSLPGAAHDAERMAAALRQAGYATEVARDLDLPAMRRKLEAFAQASKAHHAALVYTTGHGVEVGGTIYLIPGDYPIGSGNAALPSRALPLRSIGEALQAGTINLIFYGGCRDNPFAN